MHCRLVLTGGPGGGKSTAADLFRRELGHGVVLVPEAATLLFSGGFPRALDPLALEATQTAIYHVQRALEGLHAAEKPGSILLCDRGTLDGAAYWPGGPDGFYTALGTSLDGELARYDGVVFFQSAAVGGLEVASGNPVRIESTQRAAELDAALYAIWSKHPRFTMVPHEHSFIRKIGQGLAAIVALLADLRG